MLAARAEQIRTQMAREFGRDLWDDVCEEFADFGDDEAAEQDIRDYLADRLANEDVRSEWWKTLAHSRLSLVRSEIQPALLASLELERKLPPQSVGGWLHTRARAEPKTGDRLLLHVPRSAYPPFPASRSGAVALVEGDFDEQELTAYVRAGNGAAVIDAYAGRYLEGKDVTQPYWERPYGVGDLFWIALRVSVVTQILLCSPQQALMLLLADIDAPFYAITASVEPMWGLTMHISDMRITGKEVAGFYTSRLRQGRGFPTRPGARRPRDKASALIRFIEEHRQWGEFDWSKTWEDWNEAHAKWPIKNPRTMQSTYSRLKKRPNATATRGAE